MRVGRGAGARVEGPVRAEHRPSQRVGAILRARKSCRAQAARTPRATHDDERRGVLLRYGVSRSERFPAGAKRLSEDRDDRARLGQDRAWLVSCRAQARRAEDRLLCR